MMRRRRQILDVFAEEYISIMIKREIEELRIAFMLNEPYKVVKGNSVLDAGYIFAPYIPIDMTPVVAEISPKENKKWLKKIVNSHYGIIGR